MNPLFYIAPGPRAAGLYAPQATPGGARGDSGVDLRFAEDVEIPPTAIAGVPLLIDLDVRVRCLVDGRPAPFQIVSRSSIGKTLLILANGVGVIDAGYQGTLKVAVHNFNRAPHVVRRGESLFQLVRPDLAPACVRVAPADPTGDAFFDYAFGEPTLRGEGGFGSTSQ